METVTEFSQKIYKKDSKGRVRVLHVYTEGADLIQESGLVDGEKVEHRSTCTAKNIGKSNETTPEEQARFEAQSKIETKMSTGYFSTPEEAEEKGGKDHMLPMLAKSYDKVAAKINWSGEVFIQPKLDGMRCMAIIENGTVTLLSRKGKVIDTMQHIIDAILAAGVTDGVLDGELYAHGKNFQENMRLIKKHRPGETEKVVYHVYDTVTEDRYGVRHTSITSILRESNQSIEVIENYLIKDEASINDHHSRFLGAGYEGSIIRHSDMGYDVNKRSNSLLKYKDFHDITCKVVDIIPSEKRPEHGVAVCALDNGEQFKCGMKFSHDERREILANKNTFIGKWAEVRFFEYSEDGIPRFPVCVGFRLDR